MEVQFTVHSFTVKSIHGPGQVVLYNRTTWPGSQYVLSIEQSHRKSLVTVNVFCYTLQSTVLHYQQFIFNFTHPAAARATDSKHNAVPKAPVYMWTTRWHSRPVTLRCWVSRPRHICSANKPPSQWTWLAPFIRSYVRTNPSSCRHPSRHCGTDRKRFNASWVRAQNPGRAVPRGAARVCSRQATMYTVAATSGRAGTDRPRRRLSVSTV